MTNDQAYRLQSGQQIRLKADRQQAYGLESPNVTFERTSDVIGYTTPYLVCTYGDRKGKFKPKDFIRP